MANTPPRHEITYEGTIGGKPYSNTVTGRVVGAQDRELIIASAELGTLMIKRADIRTIAGQPYDDADWPNRWLDMSNPIHPPAIVVYTDPTGNRYTGRVRVIDQCPHAIVISTIDGHTFPLARPHVVTINGEPVR